jgi:hypothetical protein
VAQLDLAKVIDIQNLDLKSVAKAHNIRHGVDKRVG